jgi:hypothetical protein
MLSIGAAELVVILLIVAMLTVPIVIALFVVYGRRRSVSSNAAANLVQCRACGRPGVPGATVCPECGTPR